MASNFEEQYSKLKKFYWLFNSVKLYKNLKFAEKLQNMNMFFWAETKKQKNKKFWAEKGDDLLKTGIVWGFWFGCRHVDSLTN